MAANWRPRFPRMANRRCFNRLRSFSCFSLMVQKGVRPERPGTDRRLVGCFAQRYLPPLLNHSARDTGPSTSICSWIVAGRIVCLCYRVDFESLNAASAILS